MEFRIIAANLASITDHQYQKLLSLTLDEFSLMSGVLMQDKGKDVPIAVAITATTEQWIGWACLSAKYGRKLQFVQVFVREDLRRNGIGKKLVDHFREQKKNLYCYPWDIVSELFYKKLKMTAWFDAPRY